MADPLDPFVLPVTLADGNQALQAHVSHDVDPAAVIAALKLPRPSTVVVLAGSSASIDPNVEERVHDLLSRGVARAAADVQPSVILDCGHAGSVSVLIGRGVADRGRKSRLVGVLPIAATSDGGNKETGALALDHSDFVLVESVDPADATVLMFTLADVLSNSSSGSALASPVVGILVAGHGSDEDTALEEVLAVVRRGWPLFVLEGTGPLPHRIAKLVAQQRRKAHRRENRLWSLLGRLPGLNGLTHFRASSPELQEIVEDGKLTVLSREQDGSNLRTQLARRLAKPRPEDVLLLAWRRFSEYDLNASRHQKRFYRLKNWPLALGVISIIVALVYSVPPEQFAATRLAWLQSDAARGIIRPIMIALPIFVSLFLALETRFKAGSKYILLREAAEAVKRGIYSYRVLSKFPPAPASADTHLPVDGAPPEPGDERLPATDDALAKYLAAIGRRLMNSDVKESAFVPYPGLLPPTMYAADASDDAVSSLTGDEYVKIRVGDQIQFYSRRTNQMEQKSRRLQVGILIFGAVGAFLAAMDLQYWLPITAALVTALTAFVEYRQFEQILIKYNFAKSALEDLRSWWRSLSDDERTAGKAAGDPNIRRLVRETEAVLESENGGWVQYLKEAMTQKQTTEPESGEGGAPLQKAQK